MSEQYEEMPYPVVGHNGEHLFDTDEKMMFKANKKQWNAIVEAVRGLQAYDKSCADPNWEDNLTKFYYIGFVKGTTKSFTVRKTMSGNGRGQPYWMMYVSEDNKSYQKHVCIYGQLTVSALQQANKHIEQKIKEREGKKANVKRTKETA